LEVQTRRFGGGFAWAIARSAQRELRGALRPFYSLSDGAHQFNRERNRELFFYEMHPMQLTRRLTSGPLKDGLAINARDLADATNMSVNTMRKAIRDLEAKGFIVNLTPELPIEKAVVRLTMFPFQGQRATEDYTRIPLTPEEEKRAAWLEKEDARLERRRRLMSGSAIR
jgi:hypothetical protein